MGLPHNKRTKSQFLEQRLFQNFRAFLKEKQEKAGELTDDELENAAGGCDAGEAITSVFTVGIACAGMAILSAMSDSYRRGSNDTLLCHGMVV